MELESYTSGVDFPYMKNSVPEPEPSKELKGHQQVRWNKELKYGFVLQERVGSLLGNHRSN